MKLGWLRLGVRAVGRLARRQTRRVSQLSTRLGLFRPCGSTSTRASGPLPAWTALTPGNPLGAVTSPHKWTRLFDIALRALDLNAADPSSLDYTGAQQRSHPQPAGVRASDLAYADDLDSMSNSRDGLQRKADIISALKILFDMEISANSGWRPSTPTPQDPTRPSGYYSYSPYGLDPTTAHLRRTGTIKMLGVL